VDAAVTMRGVLVMAYGTPVDLDHVEEYYRDILGGQQPPAELVENLTARYRAIGGSPLLEITRAQAAGIGARLDGVEPYLGQKHAAPFIADAIDAMADDGVEEAVGLVLAPHFSRMSVGDYEARARSAAEARGWRGNLEMIESWHLEDGYIGFLVREVKIALDALPAPARERPVVVFSAHSLPARAVGAGDPYPEQLQATADAVGGRAGLERWRVAWQSAGRTKDPWLGPDITEMIATLAAGGASGVVVCPCGFVADHLEVLYDVDIEAARVAGEHGIGLTRTRMPNDDPAFLDMLAEVVMRRFSES
jgi:protoporphyrin/coproporphyrin ferrochelatase